MNRNESLELVEDFVKRTEKVFGNKEYALGYFVSMLSDVISDGSRPKESLIESLKEWK